MDCTRAFQSIGHANATEPYLSNMIRALQIHSWNNTPEETERLEAARFVKKNRRAYSAFCQAKRESRS